MLGKMNPCITSVHAKRIAALFLTLLLLTGCAQPSHPPMTDAAEQQTEVAQIQTSISEAPATATEAQTGTAPSVPD